MNKKEVSLLITVNRIGAFAPETVKIDSWEFDEHTLAADSVCGPTICSLISAGTEIHCCYLNCLNLEYPLYMGYSCVFRAEYVGSEVKGIKPGDLLFTNGPHASYQVARAVDTVHVPDTLEPEQGLFARMAAISMATFSHTRARPGELVLVTGLGAVGLMAVQAYRAAGYRVIAVDPWDQRRAFAAELGAEEVFPSIPVEKYQGQVALMLECSGTEPPVVEGCDVVRKEGEISLVGVPWRKTSDTLAFPLLHKIFYNYINIYSGWEYRLPMQPSDFQQDSFATNFRLAMRWLEQGVIRTDGLYELRPYTEAAAIYDDLYHKRTTRPSTVMDWRK